MYIHVYTYICIYVYTCICIYMIYMYRCVCVCARARVRVCIYLQICLQGHPSLRIKYLLSKLIQTADLLTLTPNMCMEHIKKQFGDDGESVVLVHKQLIMDTIVSEHAQVCDDRWRRRGDA